MPTVSLLCCEITTLAFPETSMIYEAYCITAAFSSVAKFATHLPIRILLDAFLEVSIKSFHFCLTKEKIMMRAVVLGL